MRRLLSIVVFAGMMAVVPFVYGADLTGTWQGAFDFQGRSVPLTFHLTETGAAVTGSVEGLPTTPADIHDGSMDGNKLKFWADTDYEGETYKLEFTGEVSTAPDEISFTLGTDDGSWSSALTARKTATGAAATSQDGMGTAAATPQDVTGTWKGSFDLQGSQVPVKLHLASANGVLTGTIEQTIEGSPNTPIDIHEGKFDGKTMIFWVNTEYEGETYKIFYQGTLADGKIQFGFGTEDGSWSSEMTAARE